MPKNSIDTFDTFLWQNLKQSLYFQLASFLKKYFIWDAAVSITNRDNAAVTNTLLVHKILNLK